MIDQNSSPAVHDISTLLARILLAAIFIPGGYAKLNGLDGFATMLASRGVPMASFVAPLAACVEFFGGLCILLGAGIVAIAPLMALFTMIAALVSHRYWDVAGPDQRMQQVQFMKNVAITGGFVALWAAGAGRISVDGFVSRLRGRPAGTRAAA